MSVSLEDLIQFKFLYSLHFIFMFEYIHVIDKNPFTPDFFFILFILRKHNIENLDSISNFNSVFHISNMVFTMKLPATSSRGLLNHT